MNEIEECLFHCRKLLGLLKEDCSKITAGLQGELLNAYQDAVEIEVDKLEEMMKQLLQSI